MFIPDLETYYSWDGVSEAVEGLAVGWLGDQFDFRTGYFNAEYLDKLGELCCHPVNVERGYYKCQLCGLDPMDHGNSFYCRYGKRLGNGEIIVKGSDVFYIAPTLIYHYIADHHYIAPEQFIEGVMRAS